MLQKILASLALFATLSALAGELRVNLPGHDDLVFDLPTGWNSRIKRPRPDLPPTIFIASVAPKSYEIQITPIWPVGIAKAPSSADIRAMVQGALAQAAPQAVESELKISDLGSSGKPGYYFSATDRAPEADGFKFLTQGAIAVDELRVAFTILSKGEDNQAVGQALEMLRSVRGLRAKR
jgi:hypothetical protein